MFVRGYIGNNQLKKFFLYFFKKTLAISESMCYNINVAYFRSVFADIKAID